MFDRLFPRDPHEADARRLYERIVGRARAPGFYENFEVPDTVDGRFELLMLHAFLVFDRLRVAGDEGRPLSDALFAVMVYDFYQSLRVSGVGDLGVGPRMKRMGQANPEGTGKLGRKIGEVEREVANMDGRIRQIERVVSELPAIQHKQNDMATQLSATASDVKLIARQVDRLYDVIVPKGMGK